MHERRIRNLDQAVALLRQAQAADATAVLWTASDEEGGQWLTALVAAACERVPGARAVPALACGDRAGDALAALRAGIRRIAFDGPGEIAAKLTALGLELAELPPDPGVPGPSLRRGG